MRSLVKHPDSRVLGMRKVVTIRVNKAGDVFNSATLSSNNVSPSRNDIYHRAAIHVARSQESRIVL